MKEINVYVSELSVKSILNDWERAKSEEEKIEAAAAAEAILTFSKDELTSMEKAKLLQIAAYLDTYHVEKNIVNDSTMEEEVTEITTEFVADMCKIADKFKVDRDKHMKTVVAALDVLCATKSFKGMGLSEGGVND